MLAVCALALLSSVAVGQPSEISNADRFCWSENAGWINWNPVGIGASDKVEIELTYISGFIWSENLGWVNLGRTPDDNTTYDNVNGLDCGVNIASDGTLSGYAWSENAGWINFDTAAAIGSDYARLDRDYLRFRGYVWAENFGWINLDDDEHYVAITLGCKADQNFDGQLSSTDFTAWLAGYNANYPRADLNGDGAITPTDFTAWVSTYNAGCS